MPQGIFSRRMSPHQKRLRSLWEVGFPKGRCSGTSLVTQTVLRSFARKEWEVVNSKWPGCDELLSLPVMDCGMQLDGTAKSFGSISTKGCSDLAAPHLARRAGLEAEVLARLAAYDGPKVSDEERAEGLLFDSG